MARIRLIIQSLIPWLIFFALDQYGPLEMNIAIFAGLGFILLFNHYALRHGFILDWGSVLFFATLLIGIIIFKNVWFTLNAPLLAEYSLAAICWVSIIIKQPLSMQYAKLNVTKELWNSKLFYRVNNIITLIWAIILLTIAILSTIERFIWGGSLWLNELLPTAIIVLGLWFTFWFPEWYKRNIIGEWGVINIKNLSDLNIAHAINANIGFRTIGKGPKLILLPASHSNMYSWDPVFLRTLAKTYQVVLIDYPDIGDSKLKQGPFTVDNIASALGEFICNLTDEKVSLLGFSMGGWIAQKIAILYPAHIEKLILIATDVGSPRSTLADDEVQKILMRHDTASNESGEHLMPLLFPEEKSKTLLPKLRAIFSAANTKGTVSKTILQLQQDLAKKWYNGPGSYQELGEIDALTLIITGAQDKIINRQNSLLLVNGIRGAKFLEFADAGHGIIYQHPIDVAEAINKL